VTTPRHGYVAIRWVGTPLHQPARLQPVDQTAHADGFDFEDCGELILRKPRLGVDPRQDDPLGARHTPCTGTLIKTRPEEPRDIVEQKQEIAVELLHAYTLRARI